MTAIGDALGAVKKIILIEERITSQSRKLEQLATNMVDMEKRLARLEGRIEGFFAVASAFGGAGSTPIRIIDTGDAPALLKPPNEKNE